MQSSPPFPSLTSFWHFEIPIKTQRTELWYMSHIRSHYLHVYISLCLRKIVVLTQLRIKADFGVGVWLSPSLNAPCCQEKNLEFLSHIRRATWCGTEANQNTGTIVVKTLLSPRNSISLLFTLQYLSLAKKLKYIVTD